MAVEIKTKKKLIAGKGLYGYPRVHSGNNRKKTKKIGGNGAFQPYDRTEHALVLWPNMKTSMVHYGDVEHIPLQAEAIRAKMVSKHGER